MAIQELEISGYRSFDKVAWRPGRLNLLVGPNASGKSNLLRMLELIGRAATGRLAAAMSPKESGGIVPQLWNHSAPSLGWHLRLDPVDEGRHQERDAVSLECELKNLPHSSSYEIVKDTLGSWYKYEHGLEKSPYWIYERDERRAMVFDQQAKKLVPFEGPEPDESLLPQISDRRTNPIPSLVRRYLEKWRVYHDIHVERGAPMRAPATTQVARLVDADGGNLASVLHTLYNIDRDFERRIDEGMRAGFGDQYEKLSFPPAADNQIQLAVRWQGSRQPHAALNLSDGTLRFLYLLTVLASPEPATLIAIDEPEIGLHPSMLPVIAEYAADAATRTQVVITSHSPEFLDCFTHHEPTVTVCQWEEGRTRLHSLEHAALETWLAKYRLGQIFLSGELDALTLSEVEESPELASRLASLPGEDDGPMNE